MLIHVDDFAMTSPAESFHYDIVYVFFIHLKSKGDNENETEMEKKTNNTRNYRTILFKWIAIVCNSANSLTKQ